MNIESVKKGILRVDFWPMSLFIVLLGLSLAIRMPLLDYQSHDWLSPFWSWYSSMKADGLAKALSKTYAYNIPYFYVMGLATYLPFMALYSVKIVFMVFDYVAAAWVYKLVRLKYEAGNLPWVAFLTVIFAPTVILNNSMWAQSDAIYASFLLGSLYFMIKLARSNKRRQVDFYGGGALIMFALALSFKIQAVFFVLPILFLLVSRILRWYIWLVAPITYLAILLPSYLLGSTWFNLLSVYFNQLSYHLELSLGAPSVYALILNAPSQMITQAGILFTGAMTVFITWVLLICRVKFTDQSVVRMTMLSLLLIPYLLPRMHERYFFAADLVAIVFAFYFPKYWYIPLSVIGISFLSYTPFLLGSTVIKLETLALAMGVIIIVVARDLALNNFLSGDAAQVNNKPI